MIHSMTGFGRAEGRAAGRPITVEAKSVNNRFRDVIVRGPKGFAAVEEPLKKVVGVKISRGRVEIWLQVDDFESREEQVKLDLDLAGAYVEHLRTLKKEFDLGGDITASEIAGMKGVISFEDEELDMDAFIVGAADILNEALDNLIAMRQTEGEAISADFGQRLESMRGWVAQIGDRRDIVVEETKIRLETRIKALMEAVEPDPQRLAQEIAHITDKADITEELVRLASHFDQFQELITADGPVGRRLEFLLQEINREVNTIGSKTGDVDITNRVVDLKTELEKLREQVQNVE